MPDPDELLAALALLAEHGGTVEVARQSEARVEVEVWLRPGDSRASVPLIAPDGAAIGRAIVAAVGQCREQRQRRN